MPYRHDSQDACPQKQAVWSKMARKEENIFQSLMQYKTGHGVQVCLNLFREALQCTRFRLFFLLKKIVVPCFCFSLIVKSTSFMFTTHRITAPVETKALAPECPSLQKRQIRPSESVGARRPGGHRETRTETRTESGRRACQPLARRPQAPGPGLGSCRHCRPSQRTHGSTNNCTMHCDSVGRKRAMPLRQFSRRRSTSCARSSI